MRLLLVTRESRAERRYGIGRSLLPLAEAITLRGHHVRYLCRADVLEEAHPVARKAQSALMRALRLLSPFGPAFAQRVQMGRAAAKLVALEGYTHAHFHDPWIAVGFLLFAAPQAKAVRWGVTEHGFGSYSRATYEDGLPQGPRLMRWLKKLERDVLTRAHWVIAPTRAALEQVAKDLDVPKIPMHWHVVHHARGPFTRLERDFARRRLSWSRDAVYILGVGRLSRVKRFPMLLDAVAKLGEGDIRLVLLGEGDREGLERQAQNLGLHHRVEFAVTDDVALYLCAADIYVSTSSSESFGLANLEALQAGLPCVCTAVGGVPEVVGDGACLVAGNVNAISDAIRRLISDPVLRAEYANRARLRAANWPDINAIAIRYEQIYTG